MGISHKKQKYIKRFAGVKSAVQLARETGLSLDTVSKILKDYGYDSYSSSAVPASEPKKTLNLHSILFSILITTVILVPLFFLPGLYDMYSLPKMAVLYVVYPLCIVLWFVDICLKKKVSLYRIFTFPFAPLILFFIWAVLSLFRCINYYEAVIHLQKWLCMGVFFWVTLHVMREPRQLRVVAVGIMLSSVAVAVIGIFQFFGVNPEFLYQAAVPGATFGNKNFAAQYIVATIPFSLFAAYAYRGKGFSKVCSFTFFILVYFLLLTRTRGAWVSSTAGLGIGTVLCIVCLIKRKSEFGIRIEWKKMLFHHILPGAFVTGILIVSALMPAGAGQTAGSKRTVNIGEELRSITATEKGSASWRLTAWKNTLYMIKSNPLFGVGIGNWQFHYPLYARKGAVDKDFNEERQAKRAHNDYLQITAELGFPGIVLFLWFMGNIVYIGLRLMFIERNFLLAFMGIVGVTSLLSLMGHAIFDFPFDESLPPFFTAVVSAMVVYAYMNSSQKIEKKVSFINSSVGLPLVVFAVLSIFNIVWMYRMCWADYFFLEGKRYNKGKYFEKSLIPLRKSLKLNPYNFRTYSLMGRSLNELQRYAESVDINTRALELHPYYINCMNNLGNALRGTHKVDEAIAVYYRALELYPNFAEAYNNLGIAYKEKKDVPKARESYLKAIELDPSYSKAYNNLGNILLNNNQIDEAVKYYEKAIEIEPDLPDVYNNYGLALIKQGEFEKAIENFDICIKHNSRLPDPHNNKGTALRKLGRLDDAIDQFTKAVQMNYSYLPAHNNLAETKIEQGKWEEAAEHYEAILKIDPSLMGLYQKLSQVYMELYAKNKLPEWLDNAIDCMKRAIGSEPGNANSYTVLGKIYMDSGQYELALEQFKKTLELSPEKAESYYNLGVMYHHMQQYNQALSYYQHALLKNPDFVFLYFEMGKLFEKIDDFDQALKAYRVFLEKWKGDEQYIQRVRERIENIMQVKK